MKARQKLLEGKTLGWWANRLRTNIQNTTTVYSPATAAGNDQEIQVNVGGILGTDPLFVYDYTQDRLGAGVAAPDATGHFLSTTEQLRLGYDADSYVSFTVQSDSDLLVVPAESGRVMFQPTTDSVTFFQVLANKGGTPILNVDTTNGWVGIGTAAPDNLLELRSVAMPQFRITHTDATDYATFAVDGDGQLDITTVDGVAAGGHICLMPDGFVGVGTLAPSAKLESLATTEQLRLSYDVDSFVSFTVQADSDLLVVPAETGRVMFQPTTDSVTFFQVLDADGGTPVVNVDTTNERFGVGTAAPEVLGHFYDATPRVWLQDSAGGAAALTRTMAGVELSANAMWLTPKYTPALKFMSTDAQFTTENPKFLAAVVGRATEGYNADTDGGMALDFATTPDNPGAASVPVVRLAIGNDGILQISAYGAGVIQSDAAGILSSGAVPLVDLAGWAEGSLIIGGAADWTTLAEPGAAGYALVSDGTTFAWDQTPTWTGDHTWTSAVSAKPVLTIENTNADGEAPTIDFYKNSVSPAANDDLGAFDFYGETSTGAKDRYAYWLAESLDVTNGATGGGMAFMVTMNGTDRFLLRLAGFNGAADQGEVTINEAGQDVDFIVEAVGVADAIYVQGSSGYVGINWSTPTCALSIEGQFVGGDMATSISAGKHSFSWGHNCDVAGDYASISGGYSCSITAAGDYSAIGSGRYNNIEATYASIAGGYGNDIQAIGGSIGGGYYNAVSGKYGAIPGGAWNDVVGDYGFAAGRRAHAAHDGAMVFADHTNADATSDRADQFFFRCGGGFRVDAGNAILFQTTADSVTAFQVFDADGGVPVFNIDTTNERVGIGTAAPTSTLTVAGDVDAQGNKYILDADGDSYLTEFADDIISMFLAGGFVYAFAADTFYCGGNVDLKDDAWVGLDAAKARFVFDGTPATDEIRLVDGVLDLNGIADVLILDADGDTTISAPTDDQIDIEIGGADIGHWLADGLYINETSNAFQSMGATINQGAYDNEILAFKSSDVAHGITDDTETDTFATFKKYSATGGGLKVRGYTEYGIGLEFESIYTTGIDTSKGNNSYGAIMIMVAKKDGTDDEGTIDTNGNLVVIRTHAATQFIFDAEGSAHAEVEWTTFDEHDDVSLLADLEALATDDSILRNFGSFMEDKRDEIEKLGIAHFDDNKPGHAMVNFTRLSMLLTGAIRQLNERVEQQEALTERIEILEAR